MMVLVQQKQLQQLVQQQVRQRLQQQVYSNSNYQILVKELQKVKSLKLMLKLATQLLKTIFYSKYKMTNL